MTAALNVAQLIPGSGIRVCKIGRHWRAPRAAVEEFLDTTKPPLASP
jgi:hypothetical protein